MNDLSSLYYFGLHPSSHSMVLPLMFYILKVDRAKAKNE